MLLPQSCRKWSCDHLHEGVRSGEEGEWAAAFADSIRAEAACQPFLKSIVLAPVALHQCYAFLPWRACFKLFRVQCANKHVPSHMHSGAVLSSSTLSNTSGALLLPPPPSTTAQLSQSSMMKDPPLLWASFNRCYQDIAFCFDHCWCTKLLRLQHGS
ncbi:TPA: hypothetical protein ACH3X3_013041 [Trebouxia sp. C0006]